MRITKILNNNAVMVLDGQQEKIAVGAGIAFGKRRNDIVNEQKIQKLFVMKENEKLQQLLSRIPEEHFIISEKIISYAEQYLGTKLNEHIHIALTDHLSYAIEREAHGIELKNKLLHEIKVLYKREYEIGLWAINFIHDTYHFRMSEDEAGYIAIHIHTMKLQGGDLRQTVIQTTMIRDTIETIMGLLNFSVREDDISYHRLITHLRFALTRINHEDPQAMDEEMLAMIKKKFPLSYSYTVQVAKKLSEYHDVTLPEHEMGYITLHIERLRNQWMG